MDTIDKKNIALVAQDLRKRELVEWVQHNKALLGSHVLIATGATGSLIEKEVGLSVEKLETGRLGGVHQLGNKIADGQIDILIFFWDPMAELPHDPDVRALLRIATACNIPLASNRSSADFLVTSPLLNAAYERQEMALGGLGKDELSKTFFEEADHEFGLVLTI
jgi:methylglyoxal synthase